MSKIASFLGIGTNNVSQKEDNLDKTECSNPSNVTTQHSTPTEKQSLINDEKIVSDKITEMSVLSVENEIIGDNEDLDEVNVDDLEKEYGVSDTNDGKDNADSQCDDFNMNVDVDDDLGDLLNDSQENIPEIKLTGVSTFQQSVGDMKYEDIRRGLYHRYGLFVRDEPSIPGVYMITYKKTERNTDGKGVVLSPEEQEIVDQYRGVIIEKETNRPLCWTFSRMSRHLPEEWKLSDCRVSESCDGSQIKIFYYEKERYWIVSTTRRIDASHSYFFSNKSFMEMFQESSQMLNWDRLNKEYCYSFVMGHPDNRVVARHEHPSLTHVLTRNMKTEGFPLVDDDVGIPKPAPVSFSTKNEMWRSVCRLSHWKEGFVVFHRPTGTYMKVINKKYQEVKNLRGSSNSLLFHFFDLRRRKKVMQFLKYYPEFQDTFRYFRDCFYNLCILAYNEYISLRVRRTLKSEDVLRFLRPVLYRIHGLHLKNHIRVSLADVKEHFNEYPPHVLRRLVDTANNLPYSYL